MGRVTIKVPELAMKKVGKYACECQRTLIDMKEIKGTVFWVVQLNDIVIAGDVLCEMNMGKVVAEIRTPSAGRLAEIYIEDAGECTYGSVLGILETTV